MSKPDHLEILEGHAVLRPSGQVSLEELVESVTASISFARAQNIRNLIVVTSTLTGFEVPSIGTRYFVVKEWAKASRGMVRVALVARPEMIDPEKFGVTVATNSGLVGDVFASEDEALAWLQNVK